jgi:hypothetical protein
VGSGIVKGINGKALCTREKTSKCSDSNQRSKIEEQKVRRTITNGGNWK